MKAKERSCFPCHFICLAPPFFLFWMILMDPGSSRLCKSGDSLFLCLQFPKLAVLPRCFDGGFLNGVYCS